MTYNILLTRLAALGLVCGTWIFTVAHGVSSRGTHPSLLPGIWCLSSPIRDWTYVPCIARHILNHWATREIPYNILVKIFPKYCMDNTFTKIFEFYEFIGNIYNSNSIDGFVFYLATLLSGICEYPNDIKLRGKERKLRERISVTHILCLYMVQDITQSEFGIFLEMSWFNILH